MDRRLRVLAPPSAVKKNSPQGKKFRKEYHFCRFPGLSISDLKNFLNSRDELGLIEVTLQEQEGFEL